MSFIALTGVLGLLINAEDEGFVAMIGTGSLSKGPCNEECILLVFE